MRGPSKVILQPINPPQTQGLRRPVWELEVGCLGIRFPHQALLLQPFLLTLRRPARCIPDSPCLSSMISQGLAGSFQPFQAFNDFQEHGDRSLGSHDEASQPISGGKEAEHSPSAGPQRAPCFPPSPLPAPGTESPWSGGCAKQKFCPESCSQPIRMPSFLPHSSPHERMLQ